MSSRSDLDGRLSAHKRRYRKALEALAAMINSELEGMKIVLFEPSSSVESGAFHLIQESNRLRSLVELEDVVYRTETEKEGDSPNV